MLGLSLFMCIFIVLTNYYRMKITRFDGPVRRMLSLTKAFKPEQILLINFKNITACQSWMIFFGTVLCSSRSAWIVITGYISIIHILILCFRISNCCLTKQLVPYWFYCKGEEDSTLQSFYNKKATFGFWASLLQVLIKPKGMLVPNYFMLACHNFPHLNE